MLELTEANWEAIKEVNTHWNNKIRYVTDQEHYNTPEYWTFPEDFEGDCEDYAIAKRRSLDNLGILSFYAVCWVETGGYHAVLLLDTDRGTKVLDNRYDEICNYDDKGYIWHKREMEDGTWENLLR